MPQSKTCDLRDIKKMAFFSAPEALSRMKKMTLKQNKTKKKHRYIQETEWVSLFEDGKAKTLLQN